MSLLPLAQWALLAVVVSLTGYGWAADKKSAYAIVGGTVFQENGFVLPGAAVTVNLKDNPPGKGKVKRLDTISDSRGEFAMRVPATAATYILKASMKGFQPTEREVQVSGEQFAEAVRMDVTLVLTPESKKVPGESK